MKKLLFIIFIVFVGPSVSAQKKDTLKIRHDFFSQLHFKNGKAVHIFKATYCSLFEDGPIYGEKGFLRYKTLLNIPIYSGSAISFKPNGDTTIYNAPYVSRSILVNKLKISAPVYLKIVVFENYPGFETKHFFVVTGISKISNP